MLLAKELALYGSPMEADDFNELLADLHANMNPSWNVEQLLYHPPEEERFCEAVRARAGKGLPDEMILRRLQNVRKKGLGTAPAPKPQKRKGKK